MKQLIIAFLLVPVFAAAQKQVDYDKAMNRFVKFYNNSQGDSIVNMFNKNYREILSRLWKPDSIAALHKRYGTIKSVRFIKTDANNGGLASYETIFTKIGKNGSAMILKNGYVETFALITEDPNAGKTKGKKK